MKLMLYDKPSLFKLGIYYRLYESILKSLRSRAEVTSILPKKKLFFVLMIISGAKYM